MKTTENHNIDSSNTMKESSNSSSVNAIDPQQQQSSRRVMLLIFAIFLLPVVIAYSAHFFGWYKQVGTNNRGLLLDPPIDFSELSLLNENNQPFSNEDYLRTWFMVYVMPDNCEKACENSLYLMRQTALALGPEKHRIKQLVLHWSKNQPKWQELATTQFPNFLSYFGEQKQVDDSFMRGIDPVVDNTNQASNAGRIYIMDPWGFIMLSYPAEADEKESILKGKDLLLDLKRLLKVSKIG